MEEGAVDSMLVGGCGVDEYCRAIVVEGGIIDSSVSTLSPETKSSWMSIIEDNVDKFDSKGCSVTVETTEEIEREELATVVILLLDLTSTELSLPFSEHPETARKTDTAVAATL